MERDTLDELRKIERADARRYKAHRRKMRAILRGVADGRGRVTTDLHHLAENARLDHQEARFALRDMERRGEGLIRLLPRPWKSQGERVYHYAGRPAATGRKSPRV
jgi:hypothetical protein